MEINENSLLETIKALCLPDGVSGRETAVTTEILQLIKGYADEVHVDNLGSVIAFKKGKQTPKNKLLVAAHMDEVGFIITGITDEGFLRFATVGGVNMKVVHGRRVRVGKEKLFGLIGSRAVHHVDADDRRKVPEEEDLLIDIGAKDREEAEKLVSPGDSAWFIGDPVVFGDGFLAAKALDDRAGCAMMVELLRTELPYDTWFAFTTQEEIGTRGAKAAAFSVAPDIALILETTASGDVADVKDEKRVTVIGGGAVVSYMDNGTIYDKELFDLAFQVAKENQIPCQTKTAIAGGNDSAAIHTAHGGVRTCAISVPCRYLHSPADMAKISDMEAVYELAKAMLGAVGEL